MQDSFFMPSFLTTTKTKGVPPLNTPPMHGHKQKDRKPFRLLVWQPQSMDWPLLQTRCWSPAPHPPNKISILCDVHMKTKWKAYPLVVLVDELSICELGVHLSCTPFVGVYILDILSCAPATARLMYNVLVIYIINTDEMNSCARKMLVLPWGCFPKE